MWRMALAFWLTWYRRTWSGTVVTSLLSPVVFLAGMGLGVGTLVDEGARSDRVGGDYLEFVAPGMLVASCFLAAATLSCYPVMGAVKWSRCYHAMAATPLRTVDIVTGHLAYMVLYLTVVAVAFFAVAAAIGGISSATTLIAIPAGVLTGVATAAPIMSWSVTVEADGDFADLFRYVIIPLSLFGGTYFPFEQLPLAVRIVGWITPLWHGTEISRRELGSAADLAAVGGHTAYLVALAAAGVTIANRTYQRVLTP